MFRPNTRLDDVQGLCVNDAGKLAAAGIETASFDTALPQDWVNAMSRQHNYDPRGKVIMLYVSGTDCFGQLFGLCQEWHDELQEILNRN